MSDFKLPLILKNLFLEDISLARSFLVGSSAYMIQLKKQNIKVENQGGQYGGEGSSNPFQVVKFISEGEECYFKFEGYYSSYDDVGTTLRSVYEVFPKQVTITEFHKV